MCCPPWDRNRDSHQNTHIKEIQYQPPTRQKVEAYRDGVNEGKSMLRATGEPSSCPPHLPSCICTTGMRFWMGKASQWWYWCQCLCTRVVAKVRTAHPLYHNHPYKQEKTGYAYMWLTSEGNRAFRQTLLLGKVSASLEPGLRTSPGNSVAWLDFYPSPLLPITGLDFYPSPLFHVDSDETAVCGPVWSKRTSGPWDDW